jgi:hypothetical protein
MIDDSRVTKDDANGLEPAAPRILARQLARPLTDNEIDYVAGGMISRGETSGVTVARRAACHRLTRKNDYHHGKSSRHPYP